jgi:hypothetical protein
MTMYVDLLSAAMAGEEGGTTTPEGLSYAAVVSRARMLNARGSTGLSAQVMLAREVAYDRALLSLCAASGVEVDVAQFAHPATERARLELALAAVGQDLAADGGNPGAVQPAGVPPPGPELSG